ncbi:ATP-binding protein [Pseudomonas sp. FW300-N2A2]|uniref:ATP-binding protein n=1 Tax=Pseudomonas sp. FW300-N2A2 TaxID=2751316 RepID=UPI001A9262F5|nr:ATP-binding protein [Pseudomonas sp. FW300-N2A2]
MDESSIWLSSLLKQTHDLQVQGNMTQDDFQSLLIYALAARIIDWNSLRWLAEREKRYWAFHDSLEARAQMLMECCGRATKFASLQVDTYERLELLLDAVLDDLHESDWPKLFDALFYHTISKYRFDRRHAENIAAFACGLARKQGLSDLFAYSGEPFVRHFELHRDRFKYKLAKTGYTMLDLTRLRLIVWDIEVALNDVPSDDTDETEDLDDDCLILLDNPANLGPLDYLHKRLEQQNLTERMLVFFKPTPGSERIVLENLRRKLYDDDLLEAVFDFTSYNGNANATRWCAWLLNSRKQHRRQTLCIDTRYLMDTAHVVSTQQLAWFAAAICEVWASPVELRFSQYPLSQFLGPLKGLFAQWFDGGYRDIDGVCKVLPLLDVLKSSIAAKRVPPPSISREVSLLDRRPLEHLLFVTHQSSVCAYIIGNNGTGKSLLLASLVGHLQEQRIASVAIVSGPNDRFPLTDRKKNPDYRYLGDRTGKGYLSRAIELGLIGLLAEIFTLPDRAQLLEEVLNQLGFKQRLYLAPKGVFSELLQPLDLVDQVKPLADAVREAVPLKGLYLALIKHESSQLLKFSDLSSGEQQVLLLFAKIIASAGPDKVLLIDEPEISLHVSWQQLLPTLFSLTAGQLRCRLVIATHSPTLIANAQDDLSHCFLAKDQQLTIIAPDQRHSVETILMGGFETYTPHNREIAERCAALVTEAIRVTNRGERGNHPELQQALLTSLVRMADIMESSGDDNDKRYQQDMQLIDQARHAIVETFTLAHQELSV